MNEIRIMIFLRLLICMLVIEVGSQYQFEYNMDHTTGVPFNSKMKTFRIKSGYSIYLNCNKAIKDDVAWQFKTCGVNYRGMDCGSEDIEFNREGHSWKLLHFHDGKRKLTIENASISNTGVYRCISKNIVRKVFVVEVDAVSYEWPPPKVMSVIPSSDVVLVNKYLTITCNVSSKSPPKILWFKKCWTSNRCEIDLSAYEMDIGEDYNCICLVNDTTHNGTYNFDNTYISKLHIFNAHVWDGGTYICSALSSAGSDYKIVTIEVRELRIDNGSGNRKSYFILLFIPLFLILLYIVSHLCCTRKARKLDDSKHLHHLVKSNAIISSR